MRWISAIPNRYKLGAMLLDLDDPTKMLYRSRTPILEPDFDYENQGFKAGVVYSCGAVINDGEFYVYYGGADSVTCVAMANLDTFLNELKTYGAPRLTPENKIERKDQWPELSDRRKIRSSFRTRRCAWEAEAAFNPSVVEGKDGKIHMLFRATGAKTNVNGRDVEISSIGHAASKSAVAVRRRASPAHCAHGAVGALWL